MSVDPIVPLTLEGSYALHQMMRFRGTAWKALAPEQRQQITEEAAGSLRGMEAQSSAAFALLGHKGDLLLVHFRRTIDELYQAERALARLRLSEFLEPTSSYLSVVELGLYESTGKVHKALADQGLAPDTDAWKQGIEEELARQRTAMAPRLWPEVPPHRYICFYPMDRKRGEAKNWYQVSFAERQRMMHEHGMIGRKYAGEVKQIISGSIGLDDWEWGVDLFSDDPLTFKRLIYEMRFDEVSAVYALFGTFYVGIRLRPEGLSEFLG